MYLINALTLKLERFDDEAHLPPYAILSHTWSGSEITFERYCALHRSPNVGTYSISTQEGLGYLKIRMACVQAVQDGLDYAWVDTCCIDKRSSAELSEAINSMFRWYQKSAICYAYLDDVGAAPQTEELDEYGIPTSLWNKGLLASSERQLAQSRWFTRGWTLQELIAPSQVHLYGRGWTYLGSKHSLRQLLVDITRIDQTALLNANLGRVSVAQRMSWAANRVTTRIEDLAYSLLGIFDVNMPLLYGEGKKAFVRLQEEILKNSADQSLFAWSPTPTNVDRSLSSAATDPEAWRSAFASHPREFSVTELAFGRYGSRLPSTLTNSGIRFLAPVLKFDSTCHVQSEPPLDLLPDRRRNMYLITLNCHFDSGDFLGCRAAIVCQKVGKSGFVRCGSSGVYAISYREYTKAPTEDVHLLKHVPEVIRTIYAMSSVFERDFDFLDRIEQYDLLRHKSSGDRELIPSPLNVRKDSLQSTESGKMPAV